MRAILYYYAMLTSLPMKLLFTRTKVFYEDEKTKENKKLKGKAIIISNHISPLDALVVAHKYFSRRVFIVVANFFKAKMKFMLPFVKMVGGVLIDRETFSFDFFEKSKELLAKDHAVLIFPEGHFFYEYEPVKFKYGYLMLSLQSKAPIVPIVSDLNYGFSGRTHILVGKSIKPYENASSEYLSKEELVRVNDEIYEEYIRLHYLLKKKKCAKFKAEYKFIDHKPGDIIRIPTSTHHHVGVYISDNEVIQFGYAVNRANETVVVNSVSMDDFCGGKIPDVRVLSKRDRKCRRKTEDIIKYARLCLGQENYDFVNNNCFDFADRVVFK